MRRGLHIAAADARQRGTAEGSLDAAAAATARKPLVRRDAFVAAPPVAIDEAWKVERMARAISDMDDWGFGGTNDVQAE